MSLYNFLAQQNLREISGHRPWPRFLANEESFIELIRQLASSDWELLSLWGEAAEVHVAIRDASNLEIAVISYPCHDKKFPSLSLVRPGAIRLERAAADLFGLIPLGLYDQRSWLDHGRWGVKHPLGANEEIKQKPFVYPFLPAHGEALHQILVGPVHAGIIEPGHFRFHASGETVVRLEERLGYVHKGIEGLMANKPVLDAAKIAARISGDSTVAYSLAFARAVEAACGMEAPPRAAWLRALMAEIERLANHIGDIGAICNDAAFSLMHAHCNVLRESLMRLAQALFGHRFMMDRIEPGGMNCDINRDQEVEITIFARAFAKKIEQVFLIYDDKPSLLDRTVGTGITAASLINRFAAGGYVGRAASRAHDARKTPGYTPYDEIDFATPLYVDGDVHSRVLVRFDEIRESLKIIEHIGNHIPGGPVNKPLPTRPGEGMALVEGFRGEIFFWVKLSEIGRIVRAHPRDPSWFQWPLLEAAIEGNIVADFPLCNKSFNCSYSGQDL